MLRNPVLPYRHSHRIYSLVDELTGNRLMRAIKAFLGVLPLCIALASPAFAQEIVLQKLPAVHASATETSAKIQSLSFDGTDTQVIGHLSNGSIYAWAGDGSAPQLIAQTEEAFAYCPAAERMVISAGKAAVLLSLRDGGYASLSEGLYNHAAFDADCSTMTLAETSTSAVEHWQIAKTPVLRTAATLSPVQSGITVSPDGKFFAAATSPALDDETLNAAIEVFEISPDTTVLRTGAVQITESAIGLDGMDLTTTAVLIVGTRSDIGTGLVAMDVKKDQQIWSWRGLDMDKIVSLEISSDELILLTAHQTGRIVLWSVANGENLAEVNVGQPIMAAALSKDVSRTAVGLKDGQIVILDIDALLAGN